MIGTALKYKVVIFCSLRCLTAPHYTSNLYERSHTWALDWRLAERSERGEPQDPWHLQHPYRHARANQHPRGVSDFVPRRCLGPQFVFKTFIRHQILVDDTEDADILTHFLPSIHFIQAELDKGRGVLVHCQAGVSKYNILLEPSRANLPQAGARPSSPPILCTARTSTQTRP